MHRLLSDRIYGLLILAALLSVGIYTAYDAQASSLQPGWFAGLRSSVWCRTVIYEDIHDKPQFRTGTFFHYPGKSLVRVMKDLGVPARFRSMYLAKNNRRETVCFDTWQDAAQTNPTFRLVTEGYGEVLANWTEADYQRAVILITLHRGGRETLTGLLQVKQRSLDQAK